MVNPECICFGPVVKATGKHQAACYYAERRQRQRMTAEDRQRIDAEVIERYEDDARAEGLRRRGLQ